MFPVSENYLIKNKDRIRDTRVSGTITLADTTEIEITDENILGGSLYTSGKCINGNAFSIGNAIVGEMGLTLIASTIPDLDYRAFNGAKIMLSYSLRISHAIYPSHYTYPSDGIYPAGDVWEAVPLGVYTVYEPTRPTAKHLQLKCYDNMTALDKRIPGGDWSLSVYNALVGCCTACGIVLGHTQAEIQALPNGNVTNIVYSSSYQSKIETYRDYVMHVAQLLCGFAVMDRYGRLKITSLANTTSELSVAATNERRNCSIKDSVVEYDAVKMSIWFSNSFGGTVEYIYPALSAAENPLILDENPILRSMSPSNREQMLSNLATAIMGINYTAADVTLYGNPALDVGDFITLTEGIADGEKILVTNNNWQYRAKHAIRSVGTGQGSGADTSSVKQQSEKNINEIKNTVDTLYNKTESDKATLREELTNEIAKADLRAECVFIRSKNAYAVAIGAAYTDLAYFDYETSYLHTGALRIPETLLNTTVKFTLTTGGTLDFVIIRDDNQIATFSEAFAVGSHSYSNIQSFKPYLMLVTDLSTVTLRVKSEDAEGSFHAHGSSGFLQAQRVRRQLPRSLAELYFSGAGRVEISNNRWYDDADKGSGFNWINLVAAAEDEDDVIFDGGSGYGYFSTTAFSGAYQNTRYIVARVNGYGAHAPVLASRRGAAHETSNFSIWISDTGKWALKSNTELIVSSVSADDFAAVCIVNTASDTSMYINGVLAVTTSLYRPSEVWRFIGLCCNYGSSADDISPYDTEFKAVVYDDTAHTEETIKRMSGWLMNRYELI